jgi:methionyl-tRNA synthetase
MTTCANLAKALAVFLKPIVPGMARTVEAQLGKELMWDDYRFSLRNTPVGKSAILARQLELSLFDDLLGTTKSADAPATPAPAPASDDGLIEIDQFKKIDLRVATVTAAERVEKSKKLLKLQVEIGGKPRQIVAGIAEYYTPEAMVGKRVVVVANLKPAALMGNKSEGMLLAAKSGKSLVLIQPESIIDSGATVS